MTIRPIRGGTFVVEENFGTTGRIIYKSPHDAIQPRIKATEDKSAKFSLNRVGRVIDPTFRRRLTVRSRAGGASTAPWRHWR